MKISKCLITLIVVMFLTSSVNAGNNNPQGSNGGPQSSPSGLSPAPQTGPTSAPSPINQNPGGKPSSSNASTPPGSPSKSSSTAKPTNPSNAKSGSPTPSQSGKVPSSTTSTPRKVDSASLSEYHSTKQRINSDYDKQASDLKNNKSSLSSDQYNSKFKSIEDNRQKALDNNQATFDARSGGPTKSNSTQSPTPQPPTSGKTTTSGLPPNPADKWPNNTNTPLPPNPADKWPKQTNTPLPPNPADKWPNNTNTALPSNPANPQSSTKNGVSGSSGLGDKKSSPNQETAQGPYWQWRDNQIKAWNNELGKLDKKQDALGEKAGQKYWSPAARSEYQAAVAALDKDRAAINQKYNLNNEQYIKTNYPEYYARNYAGKGSSQSFTGIPSQPNVSSPVTTTPQATTTTSTTKKPQFDSSIWSIEKSLQDGRSYNDAPWHNKLVRQWELDQNHPWNPITTPKDPAREAAEKATNDQYKRELEMSKLLWRRSSLPTDKALDFSDPFGKAAVAIATGFFEIGRSMATALNWVLPKDKELPIWDDYKDKDGDFKDWPH